MAETTIEDAPHHLKSAAAVADASPPGGTIQSIRDLWWLVWRLVRTSPRAAAGWFVLTIGLGIEAPILLWATKGVADNLQDRFEGGDGAALWWFAAAWILVNLFNTVVEPMQHWCAGIVRGRGGTAIVAETLLKVTRIDLASFESQRFYDRFARVLTDIESRATQILWLSVQCFWALPRFATYLGVLVIFDWRLAVLASAAVVPAFWGWYFSGQLYWEIWSDQTRDRRLASYYTDLLTNRRSAAEVRLFGLVPALVTRWERHYWQAARELRNRGLRAGLKQRGLSLTSIAITMFGLAWYVTTINEVPSAGTVVVVIAAYMELYGGVINLARPIQELGRNAGHASDLRTFLSLPEEGDGAVGAVPRPVSASELVLEGVSYTYPGTDTPALVDISLRIVPGETVALVGENGAGKTTLVKLMLGLIQPDTGRITLDGVDLAAVDPAIVRKRLSGVFQHFTHYPLSARDNVTLGVASTDEAIQRSLDIVGLTNLTGRLPDGLDTVLAPDLGGVDLSGGQWQRIAIARAGIRNASLVALDEPTASLDPHAEVAIFRRFADLAANRTTILVSHRLGMARLADRIVTLEYGRVVESGSHDHLLHQPGSSYARMWEAQAQWYR